MTSDVHQLITAALAEDIGPGDLTSAYFVPADRRCVGRIVAREACVVAGIDVAREVFAQVDRNLAVECGAADGAHLAGGGLVLRIEGPARSLLTAERTALNFLQRLSGVATLTATYVAAVAGTGVKILDTRKTTPGWRLLEKAAVKAGGGTNHRMGLHDMVLVKDNHLVANHALESLRGTIARVRADHPEVGVEIEADTIEQVAAFLALDGVDFILLDNMPLERLREAVALRTRMGRERHVRFEASGGVNLRTVRAIAESGVDAISVGALTHSAVAVDLGLDFEA